MDHIPHQTRHPELVSGPIFRFVRSNRQQTQPYRQIRPVGVTGVDQIDLPLPAPVLELFFPQDRQFHRAAQFVMDKAMDMVARSVPRKRVVAVLPHPRDQVRRHSDVKRSVKPTGQNVDARLLVLFRHALNDAVKWALKQVQGDGLGLVLELSSPLSLRRHPEFVSGPIVPNALRVR